MRTTLILTLCLLAACAREPERVAIPPRVGHITDTAGLLDEPTRQQLEAKFSGYNSASPCRFFVLIVPTAKDEPMEALTMRVIRAWKLRGAGFERAVLIVVAKEDRELRLQVADGLLGSMSDGDIDHAVDRILIPAFKRSDYAGGILEAVAFVEGEATGR